MGIGWMLIPIAVATAWLVPLAPRYVARGAASVSSMGSMRSMWSIWGVASVAAAVVLVLSADRQGADVWSWLGFGATVVPLGALFAIDVSTHRLPRQISLVTAVPVVILLVIGDGPGGRWSVVVAVMVNVLIALALRTLTRGSLGMGDVMIAPLLGAIVGWFGSLSVVALWLVASVLGALWSVVLLLTRRRSRRDHIAYGPFLIVGTLVAVLGSAF
ncbi:MAG: prepilin peptidase [Ilumatobacteraceae bacterium]